MLERALGVFERTEGKGRGRGAAPARAVPVLERALRLNDRDNDPVARAQLQFVLAEALLQSGGDRVRAVELALAAHASMAATPGEEANAEEVEGWLRKNAGGK